jgi:hypothetical protein
MTDGGGQTSGLAGGLTGGAAGLGGCCPNCGYCPTCGRPHYHYNYPYYQSPYPQPIVWCSTGQAVGSGQTQATNLGNTNGI